jgi:hypothetical protein
VTFLQSSHQLSAGTPVTVGIVSDISGEVLHENDSLPLRLSFCDRINHELH